MIDEEEATHVCGVCGKHGQDRYDETEKQYESPTARDIVANSLDIVVTNIQNLAFFQKLQFLFALVCDSRVHFILPAKKLYHPDHVHGC
jgi:hypothetical protein